MRNVSSFWNCLISVSLSFMSVPVVLAATTPNVNTARIPLVPTNAPIE